MKNLLFAAVLFSGLELKAVEIPTPVLASYEGVSASTGMALSGQGVFVSDALSHQVLRYSSNGQRQVLASQLGSPAGLAFDEAAGLVWVADSSAGVIRSFGVDGTAGRVLGAGLLDQPTDVALEGTQHLYVADAGHNRIAVFDRQTGAYLYHFGRAGYSALDEMSQPMGLDVRGGEVFVADAGNGRILVFSLAGDARRQLGSRGNGPGAFDSPFDVVVDGQGRVWVADNGSQSVQVLAADGSFLAGFGPSFDGQAFEDLNHLCLGLSGEVLVTDGYANRAYAWAAGTGSSGPSLFSTLEEETAQGSLSSVSLLAGPVPARAGQALHVSLPFEVDRLKVQVFSTDMRGAGTEERSQARELAFTGTAELPAGVYFMKVTAERGLERKESLQKIVITR